MNILFIAVQTCISWQVQYMESMYLYIKMLYMNIFSKINNYHTPLVSINMIDYEVQHSEPTMLLIITP